MPQEQQVDFKALVISKFLLNHHQLKDV